MSAGQKRLFKDLAEFVSPLLQVLKAWTTPDV